jgi:hypothetical protein
MKSGARADQALAAAASEPVSTAARISSETFMSNPH